MFENIDEDYWREQQRAYNAEAYRTKKHFTKDQVYHHLRTYVIYRICKDFRNEGLYQYEDYRYYPNLKEAYNRAGEKNHYELKKWFDINYNEDWAYWTSDDWRKTSRGINTLEHVIKEIYIPFADKITAFESKGKPKVASVIETPKTEVIEPKNEVVVRGKGRPLGSKNKKPPKELFMPSNIVKIDDGKVNMESFILAVADLVWRNPGMMDGYYLDLLNLNDGQRKYINKLFMIGSDILSNKYWSVEKKGKTNVINPKMRRAGYYSNKQHKLLSLTWMSEQTDIPMKTLQDRLQKMSIKDAIKKV